MVAVAAWMAFLWLAYAFCAPESFGRHLAQIANAFDAARAKEDRKDG